MVMIMSMSIQMVNWNDDGRWEDLMGGAVEREDGLGQLRRLRLWPLWDGCVVIMSFVPARAFLSAFARILRYVGGRSKKRSPTSIPP